MNREELVEKMLNAYVSNWGGGCASLEMHKNMDAALSVAVEELLGEPSESEMVSTARAGVNWAFGKGLDYDRVRDIFAKRRAKLERVKTPEERVTVVLGSGGIEVIVDGKTIYGFEPYERELAEVVRLGLIQQLKGSA